MIKVENIAYSSGGKQLLADFSTELAEQKINLVIGPNGAGKSTLLKLLSGQLKPDQGKIYYGDKELSEFSVSELSRKRALLSQSLELSFPFSVEEVVMMGRYPYFTHTPSKKDLDIGDAAMDMFDVRTLAKRNYLTLSGGEKQRVHFARVLSQLMGNDDGSFRFLILDEPLNALDIYYQYDFMEKLTRIVRAENLIVLGVLHDLNLVAKYADFVVLIDQGKLVKSGLKGEVLSREMIESVYRVTTTIHETESGFHILF